MTAFRCSTASIDREEPVTGTASAVRAFLLLEDPGPWGVQALRDCRLPGDVTAPLAARAQRARVRPLLVRRHRARPADGPLRVFAAYADPVAPWLETATLGGPEALLDLDLDALGRGRSPGLTRAADPMICVCTHGKHDACCAERGRPVAAALAASHPELTWEVSHIGGDRFAANVLVLPDGLYYGRVTPESVPGLADAQLRGDLDLDLLRGRSAFPMPAQVAEVAVRRRTGEKRTDAVHLGSSRTTGADTVVAIDVAGAAYDVLVRQTSGVSQQLTCRAQRRSTVPAYVVVRITAR